MSKKPRFWPSEINTVDGSRMRLDSISDGIKPMLGTTQHVFSAEITTPFEGIAEVSIGKQEEFTPRLAHCHPSRRWTRRSDEDNVLWCACGASETEFGSQFECHAHCPAIVNGRGRVYYNGDAYTRYASFYHGNDFATTDFFGYATCPRMTERERCEWLGLEYLESDYRGHLGAMADFIGVQEGRHRKALGVDMVRNFGFGQDPHE